MKIKCPACSKVLSIPDSAAGKVVKCPCGKQLRAPSPNAGGAPATQKPANPARRPTPQRPAAVPPTSFDGGGFFDELTDSDLGPVKAVNQPGRAEVRDRSAGAKLLNQYAPGPGGGSKSAAGPAGGQRVADMTLASPGTRILATIIDGFMYTIIIGTGLGISIAIASMMDTDAEGNMAAGGVLAMNISLWGSVAIAYLTNIVLVSKSGHTVGKKAMGIRMVNKGTGVNASFGDGWFTRNVVFGFLTGIPIIGSIIAIVDIVFLFLDGHETLHDKLAKTIVVKNKR